MFVFWFVYIINCFTECSVFFFIQYTSAIVVSDILQILPTRVLRTSINLSNGFYGHKLIFLLVHRHFHCIFLLVLCYYNFAITQAISNWSSFELTKLSKHCLLGLIEGPLISYNFRKLHKTTKWANVVQHYYNVFTRVFSKMSWSGHKHLLLVKESLIR